MAHQLTVFENHQSQGFNYLPCDIPKKVSFCRMLDMSMVVSEGQNKLVVKCPHCDSQILSPLSAKLLSEAHPLPTPTQPKEQTSPTTEDVRTGTRCQLA